MTTSKHFELNIDDLDNEGLEFDDSDLQELKAISQELGALPEVDEEEFDFSDFAEAVDDAEVEKDEEEKPKEIEAVQIVEQVLEEQPIVETKVEAAKVEDVVQSTVIAELTDLLPKAKQTILKAPTTTKTVTKTAQPLKPMRYPTLTLYVTEVVEAWIHNNENEDVDNYLKKKLQQANGARIVKVGPTRIRVNDQNTGDFVWTLKGKVYPQVTKFNASEDRWELAEH